MGLRHIKIIITFSLFVSSWQLYGVTLDCYKLYEINASGVVQARADNRAYLNAKYGEFLSKNRDNSTEFNKAVDDCVEIVAAGSRSNTGTGSYNNDRPITPGSNYNQGKQKANSSSNKYDNPTSRSGKACIVVQAIESRLVAATEKHCERRSKYGNCLDIEYRHRVSNACDAPMEFRWNYDNKYSAWSMRSIRIGKSFEIGCTKSTQSCSGRIQYSWKRKKY